MITPPDDAWAAVVKRHRLSDTVECRRAFYHGAKSVVKELAEVGALFFGRLYSQTYIADYERALERFRRERC